MLNPPALAPAVVLTRPQAVAYSNVAFRCIHLRHFASFAAVHPLLASPGGVVGSRYVLPGGPAALYAALDADTAYREGNRVFFQAATGPGGQALLQAGGLRPDPVVVIGVHIKVSHLLDLRDIGVCGQLGINAAAELLGPWLGIQNAPTQVLGDAVFDDGNFEGIIFPAAQNPGHHGVVLFPARFLPGSRVKFIDPVTGLADYLP